jgi:hypothetical protein
VGHRIRAILPSPVMAFTKSIASLPSVMVQCFLARLSFGFITFDVVARIVSQLPDDGGELQYRVKSVREPHERVVKESGLTKA